MPDFNQAVSGPTRTYTCTVSMAPTRALDESDRLITALQEHLESALAAGPSPTMMHAISNKLDELERRLAALERQ